jgi:hypothetical protein
LKKLFDDAIEGDSSEPTSPADRLRAEILKKSMIVFCEVLVHNCFLTLIDSKITDFYSPRGSSSSTSTTSSPLSPHANDFDEETSDVSSASLSDQWLEGGDNYLPPEEVNRDEFIEKIQQEKMYLARKFRLKQEAARQRKKARVVKKKKELEKKKEKQMKKDKKEKEKKAEAERHLREIKKKENEETISHSEGKKLTI